MLKHLAPEIFPLTDPILIFAIVLLLFLAAPVVMGRFNLPGMIGLLVAGAFLGPNALGLLARDASFILLGSVGLIYIMFIAALEVELTAFKKFGFQGIVFGLMTFALPQAMGTLIFHFLFRFDWLASVLMGSVFASHTLLAYPIVSRLGLASHPAVTATLGATMVTDTLALTVLAVVAAIAQGEMSEALWWRLGISFVVFVGGILIGLPRLGRLFFARFGDDSTAHFVFVLASVFFCAAISHVFGLEPIIGAFLAGLALNRLIPHNSALMNRLVFTGEALFVPFFLLSVGMLLDTTVLFGSFRTILIAVGMTVTVTATKWLAAIATQRLFSYNESEGQVMFGLSLVQAAATLAAVMVGFRLGLFDEAVVNATILMILVTCILGPYVVNQHGPLMAKNWAQAGPSLDSAETSPDLMVALQRPQDVDSAMELAILLCNNRQKATLYPFQMVEDGETVQADLKQAEKLLGRAESLAAGASCRSKATVRIAESKPACLIRTSRELSSPLVVMPWMAGESQENLAFSSLIDQVALARQNQLVLCHLPRALGTCHRLVIVLPEPITMSEALIKSLSLVDRIGRELGASLLMIGSQDDERFIRDLAQKREKCTFTTHKSLRDWIPLLNETVKETDLICFVGQGDGVEGLRVMGNMARLIHNKFPQHNLICSLA